MLKSYLLVALRSIRRQKLFSLINLFGLAVGMAGFTMFALTAGTKLNADRFHKKADRIYCLVQVRSEESRDEQHTTFVPGPLAVALKDEYPEIEDYTRVLPAGRISLKHREKSFYEDRLLFVDSNFLSILTFPLREGDPRTALAAPYSMVISQRAAEKYFGDDDPVGQILTMGGDADLTVTGVARDIPRTSSLRFDFLVSLETARAMGKDLDDWKTHRHTSFLLVEKSFHTPELENKLAAFVGRYFDQAPESTQRLYVMRLPEFRLHSQHITSLLSSSHPAGIFVMLAIGVLMLFVVSINFINLSTARYLQRVREIGMRKVIGATRRQLIAQFMGESLFLSFLAVSAAIILYELLNPIFYGYMGSLSQVAFTSNLSNSIWNYPFLLKYLVLAAVLTGLFSGAYPAFYLSSFEPVRVLSGKSSGRRQKKRGSKALIVLQFALAVVFIAAASIIKNQFSRFFEADLGYNRDRVAVVRLTPESSSQLDLLQIKVAGLADVINLSAAAELPIVWEDLRPVRSPQAAEDEAFGMHAYGVQAGFLETLDIPLLQGRGFSRRPAEREGFILTETAAQRLGWEDPLGRSLMVGDRTGTVIGVTRDFLFADIGFDIPPAVLYMEEENLGVFLVKYSGAVEFSDLRSSIQQQWQSLHPDLPFECQTLDDMFSVFFRIVRRLADFVNILGVIAVIFSCLGLLGLASYMVEQRTKEIGIRKVLGASSLGILWKLLLEYLVLVLAANFISLGLLYYGWQKVLRLGLLFVTDISIGTYAYALLFSLITAAAAVGSQTWRAVRANPADSLRTE